MSKYHNLSKKILTCIFLSTLTVVANAGDPKSIGDVLGRDLSITGFGFLGHVGILSGNNQVAQVMNATPYVDVAQFTTIQGFKTDVYWGSKAKSSFGFKTPYKSAGVQIVALTNQQKPYVSYNLASSKPNPATYKCNTYKNGKCQSFTWTKGSFRCDAFVKWIYTETNNGSLGGITPRGTYNSKLLTVTR